LSLLQIIRVIAFNPFFTYSSAASSILFHKPFSFFFPLPDEASSAVATEGPRGRDAINACAPYFGWLQIYCITENSTHMTVWANWLQNCLQLLMY